MALTQPKWPSMSFLKRLLQPASLRRWKSSFMSGCPVSSLRDRKPTEERIPQPFSSFMVQPSPISKRTKDGGPLFSSTNSTSKMSLSCDSPPQHGHLSPRCCLYIMVAEPPRLPAYVDACFAPPVSCMWSQQQQQLPAPVKDSPLPFLLLLLLLLSVSQHQQREIADAHSIGKDTEGVVSGIHCLEPCF